MIWLWVALVLWVGNVVKGMAGFGGPMLAIPVLSQVMEPTHAMALAILADLGTSLWLGIDAWRRTPARWVWVMLTPLLVGQYVGTGLLAVLPEDRVRQLIAIVVGGFALSVLVRPVASDAPVDDARADTRSGRVRAAVAGALGGVMSGLVGPAGPPIIAWCRRHLTPASARSLMLAVFLPTSLWLVVLLVGRGLTPTSTVVEALWLMPVSLWGSWLGKRWSSRVSPVLFGRVVGVVLLVAAVGLWLR